MGHWLTDVNRVCVSAWQRVCGLLTCAWQHLVGAVLVQVCTLEGTKTEVLVVEKRYQEQALFTLATVKKV